MLGRLAACLRIGGHNNTTGARVRHISGTPCSPNSTFWSHGAASINLPPWWILWLRAPCLDIDHQQRESRAFPHREFLFHIRRIVSDFTRPIRTLILIRELGQSTISHQQAVRTNRRHSRNYSCLAQTLITKSHYENPRVAPAHTFEISTQCREASGSTNWRERFMTLLNGEDWQAVRDEVWEACQYIIDGHERLDPQGITVALHRLSSSGFQSDSERALALFGRISLEDRRPVYYNYATTAALKLNDVGTAIQFHHEAIGQGKSAAGASRIMHYAVSRTDWDVAMAVWQAAASSDLSRFAESALWAEVKTLPVAVLMKRALTLTDFAIHEQYAGTHMKESSIQFSLDFLRLVFSTRANFINVAQWQSAVRQLEELASLSNQGAASAVFDEAFEQILSVDRRECVIAALEVYQWFRTKDVGVVPSTNTYRGLFEKSSKKQDSAAIQQLIHDWRHHYGCLEVKDYERILKLVARAGQQQLSNDVFELYRADHPGGVDLAVAQQVLLLHYNRAETGAVVRALHHIESISGSESSIELYNTVTLTFARVGDIEGTKAWFQRTLNAGLKPNQGTYFALMWPYSKRGDRDAVQGLIDQAASHGIELSDAMICMKAMALVNNDDLTEAEVFLEDMSSRHPRYNLTEAWNKLLYVFALRKDLVKVKRIHHRMHEVGAPSNRQTYGGLLTALCAAKCIKAARVVLYNIMPKMGYRPRSQEYATLMRWYLKAKQYLIVVKVFDEMLEQGATADMDTRKILLSAVRLQHPDDLELFCTRRVFDWLSENVDPAELTRQVSLRSVGTQRLDDAFLSTHFEHMISLYGLRGAYAQVSELYEEYIRKAELLGQRDVATSPPMKMLSALLVAQINAGNNEEVERCWQFAREMCGELSRKAANEATSEPGWVLHGRNQIINFPLRYYMPYLVQQSRYRELVRTVKDLVTDGFNLTRYHWNIYIQHLCASGVIEYQTEAFVLCEQKLMQDWNGWASEGLPKRYGQIGSQDVEGKRVARYRTLVWLAKTYVDLGFGRAGREAEGIKALQESGAAAKTLDAARNLPRRSDKAQRSILARS